VADPRIGPLGVALKRARERAGLSQRQLADIADWQHSDISKLEAGQRAHIPDREKLEALDAAVGADGHLLRVAGHLDGSSTAIEDTLREVIDQKVREMVDEINRVLGRNG
jgi:transcriptional regulator with XRE-family HTH domain